MKRSRSDDVQVPAGLQDMQARFRQDWPTAEEVCVDGRDGNGRSHKSNGNSKNASPCKMDKNSSDGGRAALLAETARCRNPSAFLYRFHDRPHHDAKIEWWYINGHLGVSKAAPHVRYSFFAAFFRLHTLGDHYAYASNWALSIEDTKNASNTRYLRFSKLDALSPTILLERMKLNNYTVNAGITPGSAGGALLEKILEGQLKELLTAGRVPMPDTVMREPVVLPADATDPFSAKAGSVHFPAADASATTTKGGKKKTKDDISGSSFSAEGLVTLDLRFDGTNAFKAVFPSILTADAVPTYDLQLAGTVAPTAPGAAATTVRLHAVFAPDPATGAVLHGRDGIVRADSFADEMFYYFSPRCHLQHTSTTKDTNKTKNNNLKGPLTLMLEIDGQEIELVDTMNLQEEEVESEKKGSENVVRHPQIFWVDHEFGGSPAATPEEHQLLIALQQSVRDKSSTAANGASATSADTPAGTTTVKPKLREMFDFQWEWAAQHVPRVGSISLTVLRDAASGALFELLAIVHPEPKSLCAKAVSALQELQPAKQSDDRSGGLKKASPSAVVFHYNPSLPEDDPQQPIRFKATGAKAFQSPATGKTFPNAWTAAIPALGLTLDIEARFADQEFISLPGNPSYWEGVTTVEATLVEQGKAKGKDGPASTTHSSSGVGYMECHGHVDQGRLQTACAMLHMALFAPIEMQPPPAFEPAVSAALAAVQAAAATVAALPAELEAPLRDLPALLLPVVTPTVTTVLAFSPPPTPPPHHADIIAKAVATYAIVFHFKSLRSVCAAALQYFAKEKNAFLCSTVPGKEAWPKELALGGILTAELIALLTAKTDFGPALIPILLPSYQAPPTTANGSAVSLVSPTAAASAAPPAATAGSPSSVVLSRGQFGTLQIPTDVALAAPATLEALVRCRQHFTGKYVLDKSATKDSISSFLGHQKVALPVRLIIAHVTPTIETTVSGTHDAFTSVSPTSTSDDDMARLAAALPPTEVAAVTGAAVATNIVTTFASTTLETKVDGTPYAYETMGRGNMPCRACLQDGGRIIVACGEVPCGPAGLEFKFLEVVDHPMHDAKKKRALKETLLYFTSTQVEEAAATHKGVLAMTPTATCVQYYTKEE